MKKRKYRIFVGDFETTVYDGQTSTEVWASGLCELNTENAVILHSIQDTLSFMSRFKENMVVYYHNLKFDGAFWLDFLLKNKKFVQAYGNNPDGTKYALAEKDMPFHSYKYSISDKGQWYSITIRNGKQYIELRDSLKLLPFSVKQIGKAFNTKHQKLEMEYTGYRYAGCDITPEEQEYLKNDLYVVKEALETMYEQGHTSTTIGSCCLSEYKRFYDKEDWNIFFPDLTEIKIDKELYGAETADEYIRRSYKGGWCYVKEEQHKAKNGCTFDVNSLYPSMMHSESGNRYPVGKPCFWKGMIPEEAKGNNKYFFVRIKTEFEIKPNHLPFIQIKGSRLYKGTEALETSDYIDKNGKRHKHWKDADGKIHRTYVTLTLTKTDWELIQEHYDLINCTILDGCWFYTETGLFDGYINKYKKIKQESKGALRTLAKLFLNNLYGKMAMSDDSSFKYAFLKETGIVGFASMEEHNKTVGYIPIGSAITSYARNFTIRSAQQNYNVFCYADTDSIHCECAPEEIKGITVHPTNFCAWKNESNWDEAIFTRQKTYIEHVTQEDGEDIPEPYYNVKCAGMPKRCKDLFVYSLTQIPDNIELTPEEKEFSSVHRTLEDFTLGLTVPSKLMPRRIPGGVLLVNTTYQMR